MRLLRGVSLALLLVSLTSLVACVQRAPARAQPAGCGCTRGKK